MGVGDMLKSCFQYIKSHPPPELLHFSKVWMSSLGAKKVAGPDELTISVFAPPPTLSQQVPMAEQASRLPGMWHRQPNRPVQRPHHPWFPAWTLPPSGALFESLEPCVGQTGLCRGPKLHSEGLASS